VSKDSPRLENIISVLVDETCIELLKLMAWTNAMASGADFDSDEIVRTGSEAIMRQLRISSKQYYSRLSRLLESGLLKREKKGSAHHHLTVYGRATLNAFA
jgi:hypothetical protein